MHLTKLELSNFRNYQNQTVRFSEGLNVVCGENAQGKTNLIEGIYLLSTGGSPRVSSDKEMIAFGEKSARVYGEAMTEYGQIDLEMILSREEKKRASVNGLSIAKIGELLSNLTSVYFSPDEMRLVKNSPDYRRKFMDVVLSQLARSYFYVLTRYNSVLKQRNSLLKSGDKKNIFSSIEIWDSALAKEGAKLICQRKAFSEMLRQEAKKIYGEIAKSDEELSIEYQSHASGESAEGIEQSILEGLNTCLEKDMKLGYTTIGPQRDDLKITLGGVDIRVFGSQGQQRTATLAMKLAEVEIFEKVKKDKPILLLDDVLSELDKDRQERLLQKARQLQTIITTTSTKFSSELENVIRIKNGKIL